MRKIIKMRWLILSLWVVATLLLTVFQPNINGIIREKGQGTISEKYPSHVAESILNQMTNAKGSTALLVFHNENKLSSKEKVEIETGLKAIKSHKEALGVIEVMDSFDNPEAKDQLLSKDETTLIASITFEKNGREVDTIAKEIENELKNITAEHYLTGGDFIANDFVKATFKGVDRSAIITIVFILIVLVLVFRSVVTPVVSLLAVGIAYLASMGTVAQLVDKFNFPVTSLTQMFLILVLFGIGTDYNILLFNRFKEEMAHTDSIDEAIVTTYKTAGKTIFFSGLTVFIAFASLSFVEFDVYRSGNAVAIGIFMLFIELMTLTPFFMKLLGPKLFWPSHETKGHKESKLWEKVTSASVKHPLISLAAILVILIPGIYFSNQTLSFDNLKDMGNSYPSAQGFNLVAEHFSKGKTMPTTVVLKNDQPLDNNEALAAIDRLTDRIKLIEGVEEVSGPTQPKGSPINEFYTGSQTRTVAEGVTASNDGVTKIYNGLMQIKDNLAAPDFSSVNELVKGTDSLHKGLVDLTGALRQVENGLQSGAAGAGAIRVGIEEIKNNLAVISDSIQRLWQGYSDLQSGYTQFGDHYKNIAQQLLGIQNAVTGLGGYVDTLGGSYPQLASDPSFIALKMTTEGITTGINQLAAGMQQLNGQYAQTLESFTQANAALKMTSEGQTRIISGLAQLQAGAAALSDGLEKGGAGQGLIVENMGKITEGLSNIKSGQEKLNEGLSSLGGGMETLKNGMGQSSDGLKAIGDGLNKAAGFLTQLSGSKTFYLPKEAMENKDFQRSLDAFMSKDRKTVKLMVTLKSDPYSDDAIKTVTEINSTLSDNIKGTPLANAIFGPSGETSRTNDLNTIATNDIAKTQVIVLIGIFIVLILVTRSLQIPLYIIISLMASYYTAMSVTGFLTRNLLKSDGMAWNVPFFSFIMIVALGVDYSIFLMMRYKEYGGLSPRQAIIQAAKNIGGVVISAAIILAGTFATLFPSGLQTLMQLAISVCTGLIMLSFIAMPILLPALISLPETLTRWGSGKTEKGMEG